MWKCPKCGDEDHLVLSVTTTARLIQNGEEFETDVQGDVEWTPESHAHCTACNQWQGPIGQAEAEDDCSQ